MMNERLHLTSVFCVNSECCIKPIDLRLRCMVFVALIFATTATRICTLHTHRENLSFLKTLSFATEKQIERKKTQRKNQCNLFLQLLACVLRILTQYYALCVCGSFRLQAARFSGAVCVFFLSLVGFGVVGFECNFS